MSKTDQITDQEALLVLNAIGGLGNAGIRKLLEHYGSATRVLSLGEGELIQSQILSPKVIANFLNFPKDKFLKSEYNLITQKRVKVVTCLDEGYPVSLSEIPDAPVVLYINGSFQKEESLAVAIVGSRQASLYGQTIAEQFAVRLAELGVAIISGLARGIDTSAHRGALKAQGVTIGVLGCGLNEIYPLENKKLFEEISQTGAVMSEFPMDMPPLAFNFPRRNRIISGLSLGVIVVEATEKSGALITADCALEQGREVYAIPGKIDSPTAQGVHKLIKQGAKLVTCVEDVLEDLKVHLDLGLKRKDAQPTKEYPTDLSDAERFVLEHLNDQSMHIDELNDCHGGSIASMPSVLLTLEMKKLIKQLPGKNFVKVSL